MSKVMPLSFSRLSTFEQCESKFDYLYVSKRVQDQSNEASDYGDRVHKTLEAYALASDTERAIMRATDSLENKRTIQRDRLECRVVARRQPHHVAEPLRTSTILE